MPCPTAKRELIEPGSTAKGHNGGWLTKDKAIEVAPHPESPWGERGRQGGDDEGGAMSLKIDVTTVARVLSEMVPV